MNQPTPSPKVEWRSVLAAGLLACGIFTYFSLQGHQPGYVIVGGGIPVAHYKADTFAITTTTVHGTRVSFINRNDGWFDQSGDSIHLPEPFRIFKAKQGLLSFLE